MNIITKRIIDSVLLIKILKTAFSFIISRGVAFFTPLVLINFMSLGDYGMVEYSYGIGQLFYGCALFGMGGAVPFFLLKKKDTNKEMYFYLYGLLCFLATIVFLLIDKFSRNHPEISFSYLYIIIFAMQSLYSSILKAEDKGYKGVVVDSGYYFILLSSIIIVSINKDFHLLRILKWLMWFYALIFSLYLSYRFFRTKNAKGLALKVIELKEIFIYGAPLVVSGFIMYWLTSSARVYIGSFIGYEEVGVYSFYFRIVAISIIIQQFLYITFFKKLYMGDNSFLDGYYSMLILFIFLCCIVVCILSNPLINMFVEGRDFSDYKLMMMLCVQMPIWVGISFCEGLTSRENIVLKMNVRLAAVVGIFALVIYLIRDILNLHLFVTFMLVQFFAAYSIQLHVLGNHGVLLPKCKIVNILFLIIGILIYFY